MGSRPDYENGAGEARLELALAAGQLGTFEWEIESGDVRWSDAQERLHGLEPDDFSGDIDGVRREIHPEDLERVDETVRRAVEARDSFRIEYRILRPDGETRWLEARARVMVDQDGKPTRLVGVCTDVTERKLAESRRLLVHEATTLLASTLDAEQSLRTTAELAVPRLGDVCVVDVLGDDGELRRPPIVVGKPRAATLVAQLHRRWPPDRKHRYGPGAVLQEGTSRLVTRISDAQLRELAESDEQLALLRELAPRSSLVVPITAGGTTRGVFSLYTMTSGRALVEADRQAAEALASCAGIALENARLFAETARAVRTREDLLSVVSHDLRNPVGAVTMLGHLLLEELDRGSPAIERMHAKLEAICQAAEQMSDLIDDLLDSMLLEAGDLKLELERVPIGGLFDALQSSLGSAAQEKGVELRCVVDDTVETVVCDADRVLQALSNLVSNAIRYSQPGEKISVRAVDAAEATRFSVGDSGPRVSPEDRELIFRPFFRKHSQRRSAGLGLFLCKHIIEAHRGKIWIEDGSDGGCKFCFDIPGDARSADG